MGDRPLRRAAVASAVAVPASVLLATSGVLGPYASHAVDDAAQLAGAVFAACCCWWTWRRDIRDGRPPAVWLWRLLLLVGITGWVCGQSIDSWFQLVENRSLPSPSPADVGYFALPLFAVPAVLLLPLSPPVGRDAASSGPVPDARRVRLVLTLDALVVVGSLFVLAWSTSLGAVVHAGAASPKEFVVAVGYPVTDLVTVVMVMLIAVLRRPRHPQVLLLLGAGLVALSASDSFFLYLASLGAPQMPPLFDVGFMTGPVLIGLAALAPEAAPRAGRPGEQAREATWFMVLPYLPLAAIGLLVVVQQFTSAESDDTETYGLVVLAALLVLRQLLTLLENMDLLHRVREAHERLHHQAFHDWLTGLPNRALFRERLESAVEQSARGEASLAVLFFDLDDFKEVNDDLGHAAGDDLLRATAERLQRVTRDGDTAARFGGDEFAVVLLGAPADAPGAAAAACGRILAELTRPVLLAGREVLPRVSAGLFVVEPGQGSPTADIVLHQADAAMYRAKRAGKGRLVTHVQLAGTPAEDRATGSSPWASHDQSWLLERHRGRPR